MENPLTSCFASSGGTFDTGLLAISNEQISLIYENLRKLNWTGRTLTKIVHDFVVIIGEEGNRSTQLASTTGTTYEVEEISREMRGFSG